ncbi:MAG TPA: hypothetical protein VJV58_13935 [Bradyrhizobium sp.]|nr:hypothetical protein [Bradyrhizobium sp.]
MLVVPFTVATDWAAWPRPADLGRPEKSYWPARRMTSDAMIQMLQIAITIWNISMIGFP